MADERFRVVLPGAWEREIRLRAAADGYKSATAYVSALVRQDLETRGVALPAEDEDPVPAAQDGAA